MKKISIILCILLLFIFIFSLTACKLDNLNYHYKGMTFWLIKHESENEKDYYYMAGCLNNKRVVNYFIPMEINGYPVRKFGYARIVNSGAGTIYLQDMSLQNLYMPGTIITWHQLPIFRKCPQGYATFLLRRSDRFIPDISIQQFLQN